MRRAARRWLLGAAALLLAWEGVERIPRAVPAEDPAALALRIERALDAVEGRFHALETETLRQAEALAPAILEAAPSLAEDAATRTALFAALRREIGEGRPPVFGAAVVDREGRPLAWWGRINAGPFQGPPGEEPSTRAFRSPVYSVVRAEFPLTGPGGDRAGAVRTFAPYHANLPLHNRYVRPLDFETEAEEDLGLERANLVFDLSPDRRTKPPGPRLGRRPLEGIRGQMHGTLEVTVRPPGESAALAGAARARWRRGALGLLVVIALLLDAAGTRGLAPGWRRGLARAAVVLAARAALLLLGVPGSLLRDGPFDPAAFPVEGWGGAFGTPGDALLTAGAGFAAVLLLCREIPRSGGRWVRVFAAAAIGVGAWTLFLALAREVAAGSRVGLLPEDRVLPPASSAALLLLPGLAAAAGLAAVARLLSLSPGSRFGRGLALAVLGGLLSGVAVQWEILGTLRADALAALRRLDPSREREERDALGAILARMAAPDGIPARVFRGRYPRRESTAFYAWADSPGLNARPDGCSLEVLDGEGRVLSRFDVDSPPASWLPEPLPVPARGAAVERRPGRKGAAGSVFLVGSAPVLDEQGAVRGALRIVLPADRPPGRGLSRPEILRNYGSLLPPPAERDVHVSVYEGDRLRDCTLADIPRGRRAPAEAVDRVLRGGEPLLWLREEIAGTWYHEAYLPRAEGGRVTGMVSVGFPSLTLRPFLLNLSKVLFVHLLAALGVAALAGAAALLRRRTPSPALGFRAKVLAGFILVGAVPVAGLALLERTLAEERARDAMEREMGESLRRIESSLRDAGVLDDLVSGRESLVPDDRVKEIAHRVGVPVNLYLGDVVHASSERGIFSTELFSPRLPGAAYEQVVLLGRGSFLARERLGSYPFLVGYAPIRDAAGRVAGVLSVPLLFRQDEADRDLARTTTVALALYLLVLLGVAGAGLLLARRMARPVEALSEGTRRVAAGDLRTRIPRGAKDELGALVDSFNRMTEGLEAGREAEMRAEREAAWREMAKQVAHEIKNPLTPMRLHAQHLLRAQQDGSPDQQRIARKAAEVILRQAEALQRIATDFSAFARLPRRNPEPLDLGEMAREAADLYEGAEGIAVVLDAQENLPRVLADRDEMRLVFVNLCGNAMEAMPTGGTLTIRLRHSGSVVLEVEDTGVGIPAEDLPRLFDPAFSTKTRGTGLGLAIVKRAVEDTGGTISVRSEPGKGSVFTVTLPA
jgi:signal transduction histidine kinase